MILSVNPIEGTLWGLDVWRSRQVFKKTEEDEQYQTFELKMSDLYDEMIRWAEKFVSKINMFPKYGAENELGSPKEG